VILEGKSILLTGGTGSLGKVLVRRLLSGEVGTPSKVVVFSRDEAKQHEMRLSYQHPATSTDEIVYDNFRRILQFEIGDVRDVRGLRRAVREADVVVNAAALKQVPSCEYFPEQALLTNCQGAANVCEAVRDLDSPPEVVVGVSTDKACKPVNVMGMTKALQERIFISANLHSRGTRFVAVRYGNVLASRGSVIPLFLEQIRHGGPVTITDPAMTRFLLSLDEAVDTVFAAIEHAHPGETFVPVCPSALVTDIAVAMIGEANIPIEMTGIRPGEKLHEVLISEEEIRHVRRAGGYYAILSMLPELATPGPLERLDGEFSSGSAPMPLEDVRSLLEKHALLPSQGSAGNEQEILR
jgi:FlaA1/EpsC-like NDP-sugar epimerase